jgi:hypothetical protein
LFLAAINVYQRDALGEFVALDALEQKWLKSEKASLPRPV